MEAMEDWSAAVDAGDPVDVAYLDFSKAFVCLFVSWGLRVRQQRGHFAPIPRRSTRCHAIGTLVEVIWNRGEVAGLDRGISGGSETAGRDPGIKVCLGSCHQWHYTGAKLEKLMFLRFSYTKKFCTQNFTLEKNGILCTPEV